MKARGWRLEFWVVEASEHDNPHFASLADGAPKAREALASACGVIGDRTRANS